MKEKNFYFLIQAIISRITREQICRFAGLNDSAFLSVVRYYDRCLDASEGIWAESDPEWTQG